MRNSSIARLGLSVLLLAAGAGAQAQFVGDVFAKVPSVAAVSGGRATVEIQLFAGANAFGASVVELAFQASELSVRDVVVTTEDGSRRSVVDKRSPGRLQLATFGLEAAGGPIGTVTLAQVTFDVLAPAGRIARYTITPREVLRLDEQAFTTLRGAAGEIVAVSAPATAPAALTARGAAAAAAVPAAASPAIAADAQSLARAAALRPRGGQVDLVVPVASGGQVLPQVVRVQPARTGAVD